MRVRVVDIRLQDMTAILGGPAVGIAHGARVVFVVGAEIAVVGAEIARHGLFEFTVGSGADMVRVLGGAVVRKKEKCGWGDLCEGGNVKGEV
jgi:hypothetical protein